MPNKLINRARKYYCIFGKRKLSLDIAIFLPFRYFCDYRMSKRDSCPGGKLSRRIFFKMTFVPRFKMIMVQIYFGKL